MDQPKPPPPPPPPPRPGSDPSKLLKIQLRATQPLRVFPSPGGPVFRPDNEKIAARRAAAPGPRQMILPGRSGQAATPPPQYRLVRPGQKPPASAPPPPGAQQNVPRGFRKKTDPSLSGQGSGERDKILLERYQIVEKLGEGGAGIVYRAEDQFLKMPVAIKVLSPHLTNDKTAVAALKDEARIAMRLSHSHIVHLHNLEKAGGNYFLVMEYIQGSTYRELLAMYKHLPLDTVIETLRVSSDALSYAHRHGILHNDLKPENLLVTQEGILKIIDFGISCLINTAQTDYIMGTPSYMSPEQIKGDRLDVRTDVYSLGIMTYEFLTGKTPFPDDVSLDDVLKLLPVDLPNVPEEMGSVIRKAVDPDREKRWGSVEAYVNAFLHVAEPLLEQIQSAAEGAGTPPGENSAPPKT